MCFEVENSMSLYVKSQENLIVGQHYQAIDGLRGMAVLLVLWFHSSYFSYEMGPVDFEGVTRIYYFFSMLGQTGVDLFFVLSGFLITGILLDTRQNKNRLKNFYIRRSLRIFPLYYMAMIVFLFYLIVFKGETLFDFRTVSHLLYIQNWSSSNSFDSFMLINHTWSLAVEEQFYLFWPVILFYFLRKSVKHLIVLCVCVILFSFGLRFVMNELSYYKLAYSVTLCRLDGLVLGSLLSVMCLYYRDFLYQNRRYFLYASGFSFAVLCCFFFTNATSFTAHFILIKYGLFLCSISYAALLAYVFLSGRQGRLVKFFSCSFLRNIGCLGYGIYIFHAPIMILLAQLFVEYKFSYWGNHIILFSAGLCISYALAIISYNFFENPILSLKDKYAAL